MLSKLMSLDPASCVHYFPYRAQDRSKLFKLGTGKTLENQATEIGTNGNCLLVP